MTRTFNSSKIFRTAATDSLVPVLLGAIMLCQSGCVESGKKKQNALPPLPPPVVKFKARTPLAQTPTQTTNFVHRPPDVLIEFGTFGYYWAGESPNFSILTNYVPILSWHSNGLLYVQFRWQTNKVYEVQFANRLASNWWQTFEHFGPDTNQVYPNYTLITDYTNEPQRFWRVMSN
jgi:hypothetical protein